LLKVRNKKFCLIMAIVFVFTAIFPLAAIASSVEPLNQPTTDDGVVTSLGTVFFDYTAGQLKSGDTVNIRLPEGFKFVNSTYTGTSKPTSGQVMSGSDWTRSLAKGGTSVADGAYGQYVGDANNYFELPNQYISDNNAFSDGTNPVADVKVTKIADNEISVQVNGPIHSNSEAYMYLHLGKVWVDSGYNGDVQLTLDAPGNSGFNSEQVTVGRVSSSGSVDMEVTNVPTFSDNTTEDTTGVKIRIKEDIGGAIDCKNDSIKIKLPNGFKFDSQGSNFVNMIWGSFTADDYDPATQTAAEYLSSKFTGFGTDTLSLDLTGTNFKSTSALNFEITPNFNVDDETEAKTGDVTAKLTGSRSTINQSDLLLGKYGNYEVNISAGDPPTIYAGDTEQIVAPINIDESIKKSLMDGRTVTLTLPDGAKWSQIDSDSDNGVSIDPVSFPGTDGKTIKFQISATDPSDAASLSLNDLEVITKPSFTGDLVATVGGTQGLTGDLTIAKVEAPVTMSVDSKPVLAIGKAGQSIGNITITEAGAGAINDNKDILIDLPSGVSFKSYKVAVTSGDLKITDEGVTTQSDSNGTDDNQLLIPIDSSSSEASTITISDVTVTVDRTAPQGDVVVKAKGAALSKVNDSGELSSYFGSAIDYKSTGYVGFQGLDGKADAFYLGTAGKYDAFPDYHTVTSAVAATIGTPAEGATSSDVAFVIGSTTYTLNGAEQTMDVAPYVKNGRTYLPVRYVGQALGVNANNILWDGKTATLISGNKVVQVTVGSKEMKLNGASITMDVAPEITNGRTMLPFRWIAQALGASVNWDKDTQTVTMKL